MFPKLQNSYLRGSYTVYRDVLESRHVGKTFKLVNHKHKDRVSVHNDNTEQKGDQYRRGTVKQIF